MVINSRPVIANMRLYKIFVRRMRVGKKEGKGDLQINNRRYVLEIGKHMVHIYEHSGEVCNLMKEKEKTLHSTFDCLLNNKRKYIETASNYVVEILI